jgi:hypothetical protein
MKQHGRADADAIAVHRGNQRDLAGRQSPQQPPHRDFIIEARGGFEKIGEIVPRREVLAFAAKGDPPGR